MNIAEKNRYSFEVNVRLSVLICLLSFSRHFNSCSCIFSVCLFVFNIAFWSAIDRHQLRSVNFEWKEGMSKFMN